MPSTSNGKRALDNSLSIDEIAEGMLAARRNAAELMQDASLLAQSSSGARSFTLMYTACEELAKFFILEIAGRRLSLGHELNWKRFWQRFRSHDSKLAQLEVRLVEGSGVQQSITSPLAELSPTIRNGSLYSDRGPSGAFRSPSEIDWTIPIEFLSTRARKLLERANIAGAGQAEISAYLSSAPSAQAKEDALAKLLLIMVQARNAGVTREKLDEKLERLFRQAASSGATTTSK